MRRGGGGEITARLAHARNYAASTAPIYLDWTWLLSALARTPHRDGTRPRKRKHAQTIRPLQQLVPAGRRMKRGREREKGRAVEVHMLPPSPLHQADGGRRRDTRLWRLESWRTLPTLTPHGGGRGLPPPPGYSLSPFTSYNHTYQTPPRLLRPPQNRFRGIKEGDAERGGH